MKLVDEKEIRTAEMEAAKAFLIEQRLPITLENLNSAVRLLGMKLKHDPNLFGEDYIRSLMTLNRPEDVRFFFRCSLFWEVNPGKKLAWDDFIRQEKERITNAI